MKDKLIEEIKNIPERFCEMNGGRRIDYDRKICLILKDKIILDKNKLEELIETMSTSKAILKTKGSIPYSNGYAEGYKQALQSLIDFTL